MAIATFSDLKTAAADWLNRADLTARIPDFITMAEARMNRDKRLRVIDAIARDTLSVSSQFTSLPADFGQMVNCEYQGDPVVPLTYATPQQMDAYRQTGSTGNPMHYSVIGNELEVVPVQSSAVTLGLIYYKRIVALSDSATSNWLLTAAPDIYLYATLLQSAPFLKEDERLATWGGLYNEACNDYHASSEADTVAGSPLVVRGATIG